jgi:hypothetical protein
MSARRYTAQFKRRQNKCESRVAHARTADATDCGEALIKTQESATEGAAAIGELGAPWVMGFWVGARLLPMGTFAVYGRRLPSHGA